MLRRNIVLLAVIALIIAAPLVFVKDKSFTGTDDIGASMVERSDPGYKVWSGPVFRPGPEMTTFLFSLQAAAGAGVLGFILGRITAKPPAKTGKDGEDDVPPKDGV